MSNNLPEIVNGTLACPHCGRNYFAHQEHCTRCGEKNPHKKTKDELEAEENLKKQIEISIQVKNWEKVPLEIIKKESKNIVLTTSFFVANKEIDHEIDIITAECIYGMNVLKEMKASFNDTFGGRSDTTQKIFRDARKVAMEELRIEALTLGADAVIGITVDYREISALGKSGALMMVVVSGTAVKTRVKGGG